MLPPATCYGAVGPFVHQSKYAQDLLTKFHMLDCKPCSNPCASNHQFVPAHSPPLLDPIVYRSLVGVLQYMTFTKLGLSYAVQQAYQFMSKSIQHNLMVAKRILKYLKGSLHMGFKGQKINSLKFKDKRQSSYKF